MVCLDKQRVVARGIGMAKHSKAPIPNAVLIVGEAPVTPCRSVARIGTLVFSVTGVDQGPVVATFVICSTLGTMLSFLDNDLLANTLGVRVASEHESPLPCFTYATPLFQGARSLCVSGFSPQASDPFLFSSAPPMPAAVDAASAARPPGCTAHRSGPHQVRAHRRKRPAATATDHPSPSGDAPTMHQVRSKAASRHSKILAETVALIQAMALNNRLWGAERLREELLKLGIHVSKRTIQKYMRTGRIRPSSQIWGTFLQTMPMIFGRATSCR